ncbi:tkl protein kinase, partial [Fusarium sporotrichioides]
MSRERHHHHEPESPDEGQVELRRLLQTSASPNRTDRYASADYLSKYIPEFEPERLRPSTIKGREAKIIQMLRIQISVAVLIFALQLGVTIWSICAFPSDARGTGTFFWGDCSTIRRADKAAHVALNILSSLFLGVGHYCMQVLVAPTRKELDSAHHKGKAMEIGVPSLENLKRIESKRVVLWFALGAIATLLHVFWNSSIFTSLPITVIPIAIATSDFQTAAYNWTTFDSLSQFRSWWPLMTGYEEEQRSMIYALQAAAMNFTRIDIEDCVKRYVDPRNPTSELIVVASNVTTAQNNGSSLIDGGVVGWLGWEWSNAWICWAYQPDTWRYCNWEFAKTFASKWTLGQQRGILVDYCLIGEGGDNESSRQAKMGRDKQALITSGDAIQSYLEIPSPPLDQIMDGEAPERLNQGNVELAFATWRTRPGIPWSKAISPSFWVISLMLFAAGLSVCSYFVSSSIHGLQAAGIGTGLAAMWENGFGINPTMVAGDLPGSLSDIDRSGTTALLANILIANSPQVMVSFLYIFYNSILTRQLVADEFVRFLREDVKKALRVSFPVGMQRSSHFLSLPFSIFLVQSSAFSAGPDGQRLQMCDYSARGYTVSGGISAIVFGSAALVALLCNSLFRRYREIPPGFQRMGFHSIAIQAICQRPKEDADAAFFPVRIGVSMNTGGGAQVVFSTDTELQVPRNGQTYLQPVFVNR